MTLMLGFIFYCIVVGLLARQFGPRQYAAIALGAVATVALYWVFPNRFM